MTNKLFTLLESLGKNPFEFKYIFDHLSDLEKRAKACTTEEDLNIILNETEQYFKNVVVPTFGDIIVNYAKEFEDHLKGISKVLKKAA